MQPKPPPNYLAGYPPELAAQVRRLIEQDRLADWLMQKYPVAHNVRTDRALYNYAQEIKEDHLRNAGQLSKVLFDSKLHVIRNALGTHTSISRVQGAKLKSKREIRVAMVFREMPPEFLRMIVVHELAHLREREHDKAFYQLCRHMEPVYHQLEFDLRAYLSYLAAAGKQLWAPSHLAPLTDMRNQV
ncbi:MAG: YgjP-like metallopeptidase domain-containing protein [Azonexus sp.]|jgi:predicted metal-dependent hydrolase